MSSELRDRLGLPYAPHRRPAEPAKSGPPKVWEGAISITLKGPALVIDRDGGTRRIPRGHHG